MKVAVNRGTDKVSAMGMKVGQVGIATRNGGEDIILRTFTGWVSLRDPENTWSRRYGVDFDVEILPKGSEVTLTTEC